MYPDAFRVCLFVVVAFFFIIINVYMHNKSNIMYRNNANISTLGLIALEFNVNRVR